MIFKTPFFLPWLYPSLIWNIPTKEKEIYLTFDDGPIPGATEWVLDELAKANAQATFFCIGDNVRKHPDIFQKIIARNHTIGNHTFNHLKGWQCSVHEYVDNVRLCEEQFTSRLSPLERTAEVSPPLSIWRGAGGEVSPPWRGAGGELFRPPYGRIKRSQITALSKYKIIMWDVLTHDYAKNISAERCLRGSIAATRPGSIIVFHDSLKAEEKLKYILPRFLDHFASMGYSFKAISNP